MKAPGSRRHLICSVGIGTPPRDGDPRKGIREYVYAVAAYQYQPEDGPYRTEYAPVAIARLCPAKDALRGARASVLVTKLAEQHHYDHIAAELRDAGLEPEAVRVPDGRSREEMLAILDTLQQTVLRGEHITLDVTLALRHLPFVYLAALTYLVAYKQAKIDGIYYAAFELHRGSPITPILDITQLFDLIEWYHAIQSVTDSGDVRQIADALGNPPRETYLPGIAPSFMGNVKRSA